MVVYAWAFSPLFRYHNRGHTGNQGSRGMGIGPVKSLEQRFELRLPEIQPCHISGNCPHSYFSYTFYFKSRCNKANIGTPVTAHLFIYVNKYWRKLHIDQLQRIPYLELIPNLKYLDLAKNIETMGLMIVTIIIQYPHQYAKNQCIEISCLTSLNASQ